MVDITRATAVATAPATYPSRRERVA